MCFSFFSKKSSLPDRSSINASEKLSLLNNNADTCRFPSLRIETAKTFYFSLITVFIASSQALDLYLDPESDIATTTSLMISIPIAMLVAIAETYAHYLESKHFSNLELENTHPQDLEAGPKTQEQIAEIPLSLKQKWAIGTHYLSDLIEEIQAPLTLTTIVDLKTGGLGYWKLPFTLSLCGFSTLFSALGNIQGVKNQVSAAKDVNASAQLSNKGMS